MSAWTNKAKHLTQKNPSSSLKILTNKLVCSACKSKESTGSVQVSSDTSYQWGPVPPCSLCPATLPIKAPFSLRKPGPV